MDRSQTPVREHDDYEKLAQIFSSLLLSDPKLFSKRPVCQKQYYVNMINHTPSLVHSVHIEIKFHQKN